MLLLLLGTPVDVLQASMMHCEISEQRSELSLLQEVIPGTAGAEAPGEAHQPEEPTIASAGPVPISATPDAHASHASQEEAGPSQHLNPEEQLAKGREVLKCMEE